MARLRWYLRETIFYFIFQSKNKHGHAHCRTYFKYVFDQHMVWRGGDKT